MKKNFVTLFPDAQNVHLIKDVGQIPYIMHSQFGYDATLVAYESNAEYSHLEDSVSGLKLEFIKRGPWCRWFDVSVIKYLIIRSRNIDVLNLYHETLATKLYSWLYKTINPSGFLYVKLDGNAKDLAEAGGIGGNKPSIRDRMLLIVDKLFARCVDCISIETSEAYELYQQFYPALAAKLVLIPNGVDAEYVQERRKVVGFEDKENLIITVGRLGSYQKNTELLLAAYARLTPVAGWKLRLIGARTPEFDAWFSEYVATYPIVARSIELGGEITSRDELYSWYERAKIFVLSSRYEGFPLVFPEAIFFGNIIVTTDVSGANDITDFGRIGRVVPVCDETALAEALSETMSDETYLRRTSNAAGIYSRNRYTWASILQVLDSAIKRTHA